MKQSCGRKAIGHTVTGASRGRGCMLLIVGGSSPKRPKNDQLSPHLRCYNNWNDKRSNSCHSCRPRIPIPDYSSSTSLSFSPSWLATIRAISRAITPAIASSLGVALNMPVNRTTCRVVWDRRAFGDIVDEADDVTFGPPSRRHGRGTRAGHCCGCNIEINVCSVAARLAYLST